MVDTIIMQVFRRIGYLAQVPYLFIPWQCTVVLLECKLLLNVVTTFTGTWSAVCHVSDDSPWVFYSLVRLNLVISNLTCRLQALIAICIVSTVCCNYCVSF